MAAKVEHQKRASDDRKAQIDRFKQTARELGCDETVEAFERAFQKAVPPKLPDTRTGGSKGK